MGIEHFSVTSHQFHRTDVIESQNRAREAAARRDRNADLYIRERADIQRQQTRADIVRSEEIKRLLDQQLADDIDATKDQRNLPGASIVDILV